MQPAPLSQNLSLAATARQNMIESQLRPNRVLDPGILAVMGDLPREDFVPPEQALVAYQDEDLPLAQGRVVLAPMTQGRLLQEAQPAAQDQVLIVGCGTGYLTTVLSRLCASVVATEVDPMLSKKAADALARQSVSNVQLVSVTDLAAGFSQRAPYDLILLDGATEIEPEILKSQLKEGGRLLCVFMPYGRTAGMMGEARRYERRHGVSASRVLFDAAAPVLPGFLAPARFVF